MTKAIELTGRKAGITITTKQTKSGLYSFTMLNVDRDATPEQVDQAADAVTSLMDGAKNDVLITNINRVIDGRVIDGK